MRERGAPTKPVANTVQARGRGGRKTNVSEPSARASLGASGRARGRAPTSQLLDCERTATAAAEQHPHFEQSPAHSSSQGSSSAQAGSPSQGSSACSDASSPAATDPESSHTVSTHGQSSSAPGALAANATDAPRPAGPTKTHIASSHRAAARKVRIMSVPAGMFRGTLAARSPRHRC
jgi:hypothetical protein